MAYANLNDFAKMNETIIKLRTIPKTEQIQQIRQLRCEFTYYQINQENQKALAIVTEIEKIKSTLSKSDSTAFLIDKFILYVQMEKFDSCYETLKDMKNFRKYHLNENYNYMKTLLDHLTKNTKYFFIR